jgi:histidine phosphotransferase ChpT
MNGIEKLSELDLAALLCSRICHDLISPVGAIANGLEVLDEEKDPEMKAFAMDLIRKSTLQANTKLKFARLAFGAAGSAGAMIDSGDAQEVIGLFMDTEKADLKWSGGVRALIPKNHIKLLLNMVLIALGAVPRGGEIEVIIHEPGDNATFEIICSGTSARVPSGFLDLLNGTTEGAMDAHSIQPYYTFLLAQACGLALNARLEGDRVIFLAN